MFHLRFLPALLLIVGIGLSSCEKEVNIQLSDGASQLVVNGQIEIDNPPFVVLTHSIGYFSKVDLKTLQNSFIHDARVTINDGSREVTLKEYKYDSSSGNQTAQFYFYTIDVNDPASFNFYGQAGRSY